MTLLNELLTYNQAFVDNKDYEAYQTQGKFPAKKLVMITCMDTRLVDLSTKALNLTNGEVKVIKNAGAIISHPYGSVMRSIVIAIYLLKAKEIVIMGHHDCGMQCVNTGLALERMQEHGISQAAFDQVTEAGIDLDHWLSGFDDVFEQVAHDVELVRSHPLISSDIPIHGLVIDPHTGKVDLVVNGYKN